MRRISCEGDQAIGEALADLRLVSGLAKSWMTVLSIYVDMRYALYVVRTVVSSCVYVCVSVRCPCLDWRPRPSICEGPSYSKRHSTVLATPFRRGYVYLPATDMPERSCAGFSCNAINILYREIDLG